MRMRTYVICLGAILMGSCAAGKILEPTSVFVPLHHNIPATFAGDPGGRIIYLCATQLRNYEGRMEEDHYLQYTVCPAVPIP